MSTPSTEPKIGQFIYHDGVRTRYGDSLKIQLRLGRACPGGNIDELGAILERLEAPACQEGTTTASVVAFAEVVEQLDPIVGKGFDLPTYDEATGSGLTGLARLDLLNTFLLAIAPPPDQGSDDEPPAESPVAPPAA